MKLQEAHTRQMVCKWDNLFKIVQDLEKEDATKEDIKLAEPDLRPSAPEIPNTQLQDPLRSFSEQPATNVGNLIDPIDEGFDPTTKIEAIGTPHATAVMKQSVEMPFPPLVDYDNKDHLTFDARSVQLQLGVQKHRWPWKPVDDEENATANDLASADDGYQWNTMKMQLLTTRLAKLMDTMAQLRHFFLLWKLQLRVHEQSKGREEAGRSVCRVSD